MYAAPTIHEPFAGHSAPPLYLTHPAPHRPLAALRFCPFQDVLTVGHAAGLSSLLVPGAGEPNFDSTEADPFENRKARREREVKGLLDKVRAYSRALLLPPLPPFSFFLSFRLSPSLSLCLSSPWSRELTPPTPPLLARRV